jgi:hypothetical protein
MIRPGQQTAKLPVSPHPNLRAIERVGTNNSNSAVWRLACNCGRAFDAAAPGIRSGSTKCMRCQPSASDAQAMEILMLLPADHDVLAHKLGVGLSTLKSRIRAMKNNGLCHTAGWRRACGAGPYQPVIVAGPGEDAPCTLVARTNAAAKRKYRKRIKRAVSKAAAGGKEDPRYVRHIALHKANQTAALARRQPQTWYSALQL